MKIVLVKETNSYNYITRIIPSYQRKRLIVDTIDMSVYSDHNNEFNYIFNFLDFFPNSHRLTPTKRKDALTYSKILKNNLYKGSV